MIWGGWWSAADGDQRRGALKHLRGAEQVEAPLRIPAKGQRQRTGAGGDEGQAGIRGRECYEARSNRGGGRSGTGHDPGQGMICAGFAWHDAGMWTRQAEREGE